MLPKDGERCRSPSPSTGACRRTVARSRYHYRRSEPLQAGYRRIASPESRGHWNSRSRSHIHMRHHKVSPAQRALKPLYKAPGSRQCRPVRWTAWARGPSAGTCPRWSRSTTLPRPLIRVSTPPETALSASTVGGLRQRWVTTGMARTSSPRSSSRLRSSAAPSISAPTTAVERSPLTRRSRCPPVELPQQIALATLRREAADQHCGHFEFRKLPVISEPRPTTVRARHESRRRRTPTVMPNHVLR